MASFFTIRIFGENTETQRHEAASADTKNTKEIYIIIFAPFV
jgi:hypothetical protein